MDIDLDNIGKNEEWVQPVLKRFYLRNNLTLYRIIVQRIFGGLYESKVKEMKSLGMNQDLGELVKQQIVEMDNELTDGRNPGIGLKDLLIPQDISSKVFTALLSLRNKRTDIAEAIGVDERTLYRYAKKENTVKGIQGTFLLKALDYLSSHSNKYPARLFLNKPLEILLKQPAYPTLGKIPLSRTIVPYQELFDQMYERIRPKFGEFSQEYWKQLHEGESDPEKSSELLIELYCLVPERLKSSYSLSDLAATLGDYYNKHYQKLLEKTSQ